MLKGLEAKINHVLCDCEHFPIVWVGENPCTLDLQA